MIVIAGFVHNKSLVMIHFLLYFSLFPFP
jgi:hypothetical protein